MNSNMHKHTHAHTEGHRVRQHLPKQSANALLRGPLLKSKINDNYLRENARINNLQEATLKLYLKDTHRLITTAHHIKLGPCPTHRLSVGSALGQRITSTRVKQTFCGIRLFAVGGASDAPLKIKSSLIKQIIHLL